jgi:hypothetical protein
MSTYRKGYGYGVLTYTETGKVEEHDTFSCRHCQRATIVKPGHKPEDLGGLCGHCWGLLCPQCAASGRCDPLEEKIARWEHRGAALRSYGVG